MSWTAAATITIGAVTAFVDSNNADHAQDASNTAIANANVAANNQIATAEQQKVNTQNQQANATQVAQARVRAISNPDYNAFSTPAGTSQAPQGTGAIGAAPGKGTIGG